MGKNRCNWNKIRKKSKYEPKQNDHYEVQLKLDDQSMIVTNRLMYVLIWLSLLMLLSFVPFFTRKKIEKKFERFKRIRMFWFVVRILLRLLYRRENTTLRYLRMVRIESE